MIYMDNAATSFPKPIEVIDAVKRALMAPASPGRSGHKAALEASRVIHKARRNIAKIFGIQDNSRLVFFSNITWALNTAISGIGLQEGQHVITSSLEHNAVARALSRLVAEKGIKWDWVPLDAQGLADPADFKKLLRPDTKLIVLNHASNVTGALNDVQAIRAASDGLPLLLDVAQSAGAVDLQNITEYVDMLAFTGHKSLLGPTGTGGLWLKEGLELRPLAVGGTGSKSESLEAPSFLPDAFEAGTANTHGLAGLAAGAAYVLNRGVEEIRRHEMELSKIFLEALDGISGLKVFGPKDFSQRVATISLSLEGWPSSELAYSLEEEEEILTRAGLHCAPLAHQALGTLKQGGLIRFSFGPFNTKEEILTAVKALEDRAGRKR